MLIIPLHRKWSRSNFPIATLLLVMANLFVFLFLQSGDAKIYRQAFSFYVQSDLGAVEFPAYARWLGEHGRTAPDPQAAARQPGIATLMRIESDGEFLADLHADKVITPADPRYPQWHDQRTQFDAILDRSFTRAHALRFSHLDPGRMLSAMFMHGGIEHLLGNMLFLLAVGMLVEGALGSGWYLALYLAGGIGAALASTAWHWGSAGNSLGASGAIAALMGAYSVIWGRRKVRVFYWFFVVFDYVKLPALLALGCWAIWLVVLPWMDTGSRVDYADHAGGLLAGVGLALAMRRRGIVRETFVAEDERVERQEHDDSEFEQALQWIGQMEIAKARAILDRLDKATPDRLRIRAALYRCARYQGTPEQLDRAAQRVFESPAATDADARQVQATLDDYLQACNGVPRLAAPVLLPLLPLLQRLGADASMDALLRGILTREPADPALPGAWFGLALRTPDGDPARRGRLEFLLNHWPDGPFAAKARFLLTADAGSTSRPPS